MPTAARHLSPLAVLALVLVARAVSGTAQDRPAGPPEVPVRRLACGTYDVVPSGFRGPGGQPTRLTIQKGGRLLVSVTDWRVVAVECDDINADGTLELVVRTFSGGAHCCETLRVYSLGDTPRLLLRYEANNAMGAEVRDVNGDGKRELILGDDSFAYFDDLCYACSPANLPLVACYTGTRFEDCTREFPDMLRARRDAFLARVQPAANEEELKHVQGAALGVVALSAVLGDEQQGLEAVRKAVTSDALMAWLSKALPQVRDWVAARGRKLKDGKGS